MIISLIMRSEHEHVYVTYKAEVWRKEQFKALGIELVEIGTEDRAAAIKFMKENVDIVHAANSGGPEPGVSIGVDAQKPTIETCQSPSLPSGANQNLVTVVLVSQGILDYWDDGLADRVIYSCAEPIPDIPKDEAKAFFGLDFNRLVVGRVGRFEGLKRPLDFVRASFLIHRTRPDTEFLLVGDGIDGQGVRYEAEHALRRGGPDIRMPGFLTGRDKELAYNAIDVFLYPTSMEGFGIVFAEAMSLGLPIVTYSDPVNLDVVGPGGVFVLDNLFTQNPRPYYALSAITLDLLENKRDRKLLGERSRRRYEARYTPERMAAEYDALYEELIG